MSPILCPHCGTANRAGSNFCNRCGASLRGEAPPPPVSEAAAPRAPDTGAPDAPPPAAETVAEDAAAATATPRPAPGETAASPAAGATPGAAPGEEGSTRPPQTPGDQPWLQPGFSGPDDAPGEGEDEPEDVDAGLEEGAEIPTAPGRLVSGIQGLIEPIRVATVGGEGDGEPAPLPVTPTDADRLRRVRLLLGEEPLLAASPRADWPGSGLVDWIGGPSLWLPAVFLLLGAVLAIAVFWQLERPTGVARQWPGVAEAYAAVEGLPPQATVQVLWAYDPATAGELDLLAAPLLRHLLDRGAQLQVVSLLPNGPATARRMLAAVHADRRELRAGAGTGEAALSPPRFLPGGVLALPGLGAGRADLAVVLAAEAEDAQGWLEQVQPRNGAPVVAATAAGADPLLRPYLASGQLAGLVSGFDGAAAYTELLDDGPTRARERQMEVQLVGQNLATIVFLFLIAAGNLVLLINGRQGDA